jgi:hypothetical protein
VAPLAGVVNAQSPPELCGLWGEPYGLLWLLIFSVGVGVANREPDQRGATVHPGLMCPVNSGAPTRALLLNGPLDQDPG